jgi:hypothetical protein
MRFMAAIHSPKATRKILDCLGLHSRAPPMAPGSTNPPSRFDQLLRIPRHSDSDMCQHLPHAQLISSAYRLDSAVPKLISAARRDLIALASYRKTAFWRPTSLDPWRHPFML